MFDEDGALALVPEYEMVVGLFAGFRHDQGCVDIVGFERVDAELAVVIVAHMDTDAGTQSESPACNRRIGAVADSRHFDRELKGDFVAESYAEHAVLIIDVAVDACIFEPDELVYHRVSYRKHVESHVNNFIMHAGGIMMRMKTLREAIEEARAESRALGHFNISDSNQLKALALASQSTGLPVIVGLSEGEREFFPLAHARTLVDAYRFEGIQLYLNADHTYGLEKAQAAIDEGVDSIVVDGAKMSAEENISFVRAVVEYARESGRDVVVEGELGYIGQSSKLHDELPAGVTLENLTTPEESARFVRETGIDCLAPAVGNVHGMLKSAAEPRLHPDRVADIAASAGVPLVLHGASGNTAEDIRACIASGVAVVHINTELRVAYRDALRASLGGDEVAPYKFLAPAVETMATYVSGKLREFAGL